MTSRPHRHPVKVAVISLLALASCSDDGSSTTDGGAEAATPATSDAPSTTVTAVTTETTPVESTEAVAAGVASGSEQFTPVTIEVLSTPRWFTNSEGLVRLVYEVRMTNAFPFPATVTEVTITDTASGEPVQTLS